MSHHTHSEWVLPQPVHTLLLQTRDLESFLVGILHLELLHQVLWNRWLGMLGVGAVEMEMEMLPLEWEVEEVEEETVMVA
jgi:hypothetical protein